MKTNELKAVCWAVLNKTSAKELRRDDLGAGQTHEAHVAIAARIGGQKVEQIIEGSLSIGHDTQRASSSGPKPADVLGVVLDKLNDATREAILRDLPEQYAAAGNQLPPIAKARQAEAKQLLERLRNKSTEIARGAVACNYRLTGSLVSTPVAAHRPETR